MTWLMLAGGCGLPLAVFALVVVFDFKHEKREAAEFARHERDARIADLEYDIYQRPQTCQLIGHRWRPDPIGGFGVCGRCGVVQEGPRPFRMNMPERDR